MNNSNLRKLLVAATWLGASLIATCSWAQSPQGGYGMGSGGGMMGGYGGGWMGGGYGGIWLPVLVVVVVAALVVWVVTQRRK
jgi:uncharacterized membrane protein